MAMMLIKRLEGGGAGRAGGVGGAGGSLLLSAPPSPHSLPSKSLSFAGFVGPVAPRFGTNALGKGLLGGRMRLTGGSEHRDKAIMRKKRTREEMISPQMPSARTSLSLASFSTSSPGPEQNEGIHPEEGLQGEELPPLLAAWVDRLPQDLLEVIRVIEEEGGGRVWLVGGCVRDCLSGLMPWEIDLATTLEPSDMLRLFPRALDTGSQYGTVTIRKGGISVEATTGCFRLRADGSYGDGRRPETVTFGRSLKEDL
eukprot:756585-Hanusia_phi.AAC.4